MYEIAICDDDAAFAAGFRTMLTRALERRGCPFHMSMFSDLPSLMASIEGGCRYALLFLDVVFDQTQQGIRFAVRLREMKVDAAVIFLSADPDYALDSYDAAALYYLKKPVDPAKLDAALDRYFQHAGPRTLLFPTSGGQLRLRQDDILYFEIYSHVITIHMAGGGVENSVGTLRDLEASLPPQSFVRPHRSYLVNLGHIASITRYRMRLSSGDEIPISKKLYQQIQNAFIDYADRDGPSG